MDCHRGPSPRRTSVVTIRVVIADDQQLIRAGLTTILDAQPDIEVIGEASNGRDAVALSQHQNGHVNTTLEEHWLQGRARLTSADGDELKPCGGTGVFFNNANIRDNYIKSIPNRSPHRIKLLFRPGGNRPSESAAFNLDVSLDVYYTQEGLSTGWEKLKADISFSGLSAK